MDSSRDHKRRRLNEHGSNTLHDDKPGLARGRGRDQKSWMRTDQARINEIQEAERHREFMSKEGQFVLQQKRKAAAIRVKEGRARPVDFLAVNLELIDPMEDLINDDGEKKEPVYTEPATIIKALSSRQVVEMLNDIDQYLEHETRSKLRDYWSTMKVLCEHQRQSGADGKAVRSVSADIDKLLRPKSYDELLKLEKQVNSKLDSDEPIDTDYWQQLLKSLVYYKALAKVERLRVSVTESNGAKIGSKQTVLIDSTSQPPLPNSETVKPAPAFPKQPQGESLLISDESNMLSQIAADGRRGLAGEPTTSSFDSNRNQPGSSRNQANADLKASKLYHDEASKGVEDDEEVFVGEEDVITQTAAVNVSYRSRKPRYFNRVQMGYEWNKYNQTHYDQENPPPKVVQGYKFHIFYPDLIDPAKAPTYRITREDGRKRGETFAPAGEEDTCIIRFMSGPPYEDVAFRIVDREWDHSAKHERGFQSTFENGILTLHFTFKKIYYRK